MKKSIHGIVVPMVTPLRKDETVDETATRRLVRRLVDGGVHAVFVLGTAGEAAALPDAERRRVMEIVADENAGKAKVVAGIGAVGTKETIANARTAAALGADAAVVVSPYYYPLDQAELAAHHRAVADASELPTIAYTIPATTKLTLTMETTLSLSEHPNIIGIKDSSGDFAVMQRLANLFRKRSDFSVLVGHQALMGMGMLSGADGSVPTLANICPRLLVDLYNAAIAHDAKRTCALQAQVDELTATYRFGNRWSSGIQTVKIALNLLGICSDRMTAPMGAPNPALKRAVRKLLRDHELLK